MLKYKTLFDKTFQYMDFFIYTKSYRADDALRSFSPQLRNCYFEGEKVLKYFKTYTKAMCEYECNTNFTLSVCGCVQFSMPRGKNTRICRIDEMNCIYSLPKVKCDCLSPCFDIRYSYRYDKAVINRKFYEGLVPDK